MCFNHESMVTRRAAIGCYSPTAPSGRLNARSKHRKTANLKIQRIRSAMSQWYVITLIAVESSPPPPNRADRNLAVIADLKKRGREARRELGQRVHDSSCSRLD
jgi:hypothetical protein